MRLIEYHPEILQGVRRNSHVRTSQYFSRERTIRWKNGELKSTIFFCPAPQWRPTNSQSIMSFWDPPPKNFSGIILDESCFVDPKKTIHPVKPQRQRDPPSMPQKRRRRYGNRSSCR
jgi:hypothetical protein